MKPTLIIMAAGMGSRFGGCKQIAPVDNEGQIIIDYSIYDAIQAGFDCVVCVIKPEMEADFKKAVGDRIAEKIEVRYAYQRLDAIPEGYAIPEGRVKPWGTAHAVLCALPLVDGPFAVINADDFYGRDAFKTAADFLMAQGNENEHAMVGYLIENTLTENGSVSRGVCEGDANGYLTDINERTRIEVRPEGPAYTEDDGATYTPIAVGTPVSMNLWAFRNGIRSAFAEQFEDFLKNTLTTNPMKAECYLPYVPKKLIQDGKATVKLLSTHEKWYGMTYREDIDKVKNAIAQMKQDGVYPDVLF